MYLDLPGHADEVFSVDWSPDGERVASGGRDRVLKMYVKLFTHRITGSLFIVVVNRVLQ